MKHLHQFFLAMLMALFSVTSISAYDFEAKNADGKTIYYNYLTNNTCAVAGAEHDGRLNLNVPSTIRINNTTITVTEIAERAFANTSLNNISLPNTIVKIGDRAFWYCRLFLEHITIPSSVTYIGDEAFYDCSNLKSISTLPSTLEYIGYRCFHNTWYYNNSENWNNDDLYNGRNLIASKKKGVNNVKEGTRIVAGGAFFGNEDITSVSIPESVISIGPGCFNGCSKLKSVVLPSSLESIYDNTFYGCTALSSIQIPNNVTTIGNNAFRGCSSLQSIDIPKGVTKIGESAFNGCSWLKEITIPEGIENLYGSCFEGCEKLEKVNLPKGLVSIGESCFKYCNKLSTITIPKGVNKIEAYAFVGCSKLDDLICHNPNPPSVKYSFSQTTYLDCVLYVPKDAVDSYSKAEGWCNFFNIVGIDVEDDPNITPGIKQTDNVLSIESIKTSRGKVVELPVSMTNKNAITEIGFVVELPNGISLDKTAKGKYYVNFSDRADGHTMTANDVAGGVKMAIVNMDATPFEGNSGTVFSLPLNIDSNLAEGDYTIRLKEVQLSDGNLYEAEDAVGTVTVQSYTKGDVNNDGRIAVNDISLTIQGYLGNYSDDFIMYAADMNDNNQIDVADISQVVSKYLGTAALAPQRANVLSRAATSDNLTLENATVEPGKQFDLVIGLNNTKEYTEIGGYIRLPKGMTFATNSKGKYLISLDRDRLPEHSVSTQIQSSGELKFALVNMAGDPVDGNSGTIMKVTVNVAEDMADGAYEVRLREIQLSDGNLYETDDVTATITVGSNNAIGEVLMDSDNGNGSLYRLDGTKLSRITAPGLYIKNGKKFVVK